MSTQIQQLPKALLAYTFSYVSDQLDICEVNHYFNKASIFSYRTIIRDYLVHPKFKSILLRYYPPTYIWTLYNFMPSSLTLVSHEIV